VHTVPSIWATLNGITPFWPIISALIVVVGVLAFKGKK